MEVEETPSEGGGPPDIPDFPKLDQFPKVEDDDRKFKLEDLSVKYVAAFFEALNKGKGISNEQLIGAFTSTTFLLMSSNAEFNEKIQQLCAPSLREEASKPIEEYEGHPLKSFQEGLLRQINTLASSLLEQDSFQSQRSRKNKNNGDTRGTDQAPVIGTNGSDPRATSGSISKIAIMRAAAEKATAEVKTAGRLATRSEQQPVAQVNQASAKGTAQKRTSDVNDGAKHAAAEEAAATPLPGRGSMDVERDDDVDSLASLEEKRATPPLKRVGEPQSQAKQPSKRSLEQTPHDSTGEAERPPSKVTFLAAPCRNYIRLLDVTPTGGRVSVRSQKGELIMDFTEVDARGKLRGKVLKQGKRGVLVASDNEVILQHEHSFRDPGGSVWHEFLLDVNGILDSVASRWPIWDQISQCSSWPQAVNERHKLSSRALQRFAHRQTREHDHLSSLNTKAPEGSWANRMAAPQAPRPRPAQGEVVDGLQQAIKQLVSTLAGLREEVAQSLKGVEQRLEEKLEARLKPPERETIEVKADGSESSAPKRRLRSNSGGGENDQRSTNDL